ncbi:hypothetical protein [Streptomyces sp. BPTC-684]|uniref:hypothetical protein n=1 Tax=Streptomyces sp. BPTC-684 TaxID=3043734 RepID=UPI0024B1C328|nr:hypothetical protein [Streptomyces sp. BPTC-684]WHM37878.1 hypothetical protein QIY60_13820 [Streptomyces sp. BPTC-684]
MPVPDGPAHLPLRWDGGETPFVLWHFDFGGDRWTAVYTGDIHSGEPVPLRIESACVFGHVLRSAQCDCGYQLEQAMDSFARNGRGLLLYGIDQDARGLGIAAHYAIYAMRQQENLDTDAVYARLDAPVDARSYEPVVAILRHLGISAVQLLSNNLRREAFLRESGFDVELAPLEAPLDIHNMSTLMLEKEDLAYRWSFETHADWLEPLQESVAQFPDRSVACAALPGGGTAGTPLARADDDGDWNLAHRLATAMPTTIPAGTLVVYLTDLPRADDLAVYAALGAAAVVVPFADLPAPLREAAAAEGIKLVDWERRNAYRTDRPQWRLEHRSAGIDIYRRGDRLRCVAAPADGDGARIALKALRETFRTQPGTFGTVTRSGSDASWFELAPSPGAEDSALAAVLSTASGARAGR